MDTFDYGLVTTVNGVDRPATADEAAHWADVMVAQGTFTEDAPEILQARGKGAAESAPEISPAATGERVAAIPAETNPRTGSDDPRVEV